MTPKEVEQREFEKAVFGGYDMTTVDNFISEITDDYSALFKENSVLKSKLKVLVEKVEEYRATEDSMRMALLTAQKMGNEIVEEANKQGEKIVNEAQRKAEQTLESIKEQVDSQRAQLETARQATSKYSQAIIDIYKRQLEYIKNISGLVLPADLEKAISSKQETQEHASKNAGSVNRKTMRENQKPIDLTDALNQPVESLLEQAMSHSSSYDDNDADAHGDIREDEQKHINVKVVESDEKDDIARSISESLGDKTELHIDPNAQDNDDDEPTTKRPRFDFNDLQFGSRFGEEE